MGIRINTIGNTWSWNDKENKWRKHIHLKGLEFTKTGNNFFRWKKKRKSFAEWSGKCLVCEEKICGHFIGQEYSRICPKCAGKWLDNSQEELKRIIEVMDKLKEELKDNKKEWISEGDKKRLLWELQK